MSKKSCLTAAGLLQIALLVSSGCSAPSAQLTSCQNEKEQLLATIGQQRDANSRLHEQVASLETRLDQAEKVLARSGGTRLSSRPPEAATPVKSEPLPWRSHQSKASLSSAESAGESLSKLATRDRRLDYDPQSGAARFDVAVSFEDQSAKLTAEGKRQLDELARFLKSDAAREKRVMVAGYAAGRPSTTEPIAEGEQRFTSARQLAAARAQAVADYLDRHGITQERLAVTGTGTSTGRTGGVDVFLLEPDAPIVGWGKPQTLRR
jgi:outer membrane protein OmpA-like peptidoglycan-associated protein